MAFSVLPSSVLLYFVLVLNVNGQSNMLLNEDPWKGYLGSVCLPANPPCLVANSECQESACRCVTGYKANNGFCVASNVGCPGGRSAYITETDKMPLQCTVIPDNCPMGYQCTRSTSTVRNENICCAVFEDYCPSGSAPFYSTTTGQATLCGPNIPCAVGFACLNYNGRYICCSVTAQANLCPAPSRPYVDPNTRQLRQCGGLQGTCPQGYSCVGTNGASLCCSSQGTPNQQTCPAGRVPNIDPATQRIRTCLAAAQDCPTGFYCEYSGSGYICCSVTRMLTGGEPDIPLPITCPENSVPYQDPLLTPSTYRSCNSTTPCPLGYQCSSQANICCSLVGTTQRRYCPEGRQEYFNMSSSTVLFCNSNNDQCPAGYSCTFFGTTFTCCSRSGAVTCPTGSTPLTDARNQVVFCNATDTTRAICPGTHACTRSGFGDICCVSLIVVQPQPPVFATVAPVIPTQPPVVAITTPATSTDRPRNFCPANWEPYIDPVSRRAKSCDPTNAADCPLGFQCTTNVGTSVCCLAGGETQYCPRGMSPYVTESNLILSCNPQITGVCPSFYSCQLSDRFRTYICCTPTVAREDTNRNRTSDPEPALGFCPAGSTVLRNPLNLPQSCQVAKGRNDCPSGFVCYYPFPTIPLGFCCAVKEYKNMAYCPKNNYPLMSTITNTPVVCTNESDTRCPTLYSCMFNENYATNYCCSEIDPSTLDESSGTLNHTCLPIKDQSCTVANSICSAATNTCVCKEDYYNLKTRCLSKEETNQHLKDLLLDYLKPVGNVMGEAYVQMKGYMDQWIDRKLKDEPPSEHKTFWTDLRYSVLHYLCNCTDIQEFESQLVFLNVNRTDVP